MTGITSGDTTSNGSAMRSNIVSHFSSHRVTGRTTFEHRSVECGRLLYNRRFFRRERYEARLTAATSQIDQVLEGLCRISTNAIREPRFGPCDGGRDSTLLPKRAAVVVSRLDAKLAELTRSIQKLVVTEI